MSQKNEFLLSIIDLRPEIIFQKEKCVNEVEYFTHATLRPVLKYLNIHLQKLVISVCMRQNAEFKHTDTITRNRFVMNTITKNSSLKNQLIGCTISMLTPKELDFYLLNQKNLNNRIIKMIQERVLDQYSKFLP
jgi:hypothetical protein